LFCSRLCISLGDFCFGEELILNQSLAM
jgi:hypothetical protein